MAACRINQAGKVLVKWHGRFRLNGIGILTFILQSQLVFYDEGTNAGI